MSKKLDLKTFRSASNNTFGWDLYNVLSDEKRRELFWEAILKIRELEQKEGGYAWGSEVESDVSLERKLYK